MWEMKVGFPALHFHTKSSSPKWNWQLLHFANIQWCWRVSCNKLVGDPGNLTWLITGAPSSYIQQIPNRSTKLLLNLKSVSFLTIVSIPLWQLSPLSFISLSILLIETGSQNHQCLPFQLLPLLRVKSTIVFSFLLNQTCVVRYLPFVYFLHYLHCALNQNESQCSSCSVPRVMDIIILSWSLDFNIPLDLLIV